MKFLDKENRRKLAAGAVLVGAAAVTVTTVVFAAGGGMGGGPGGGGGTRMAMEEKAKSVINVKLTTPEIGTIMRETEFIGKIESADSVSVYPDASGKIQEIYFDAGDTVQAGALLMRLDSSDYEFALTEAEASYASQVASANKTLGSDYTSKLISAQNSLAKTQRSYRSARQNYAREVDNEDANLEDLIEQKDKAYTALTDAQSDWVAAGGKKPASESYDPEEFPEYAALQDAKEAYDKIADKYYNAIDDYDESTSDYAVSKDNAYKDVLEAEESLSITSGIAYEEQKAVIEAQLTSAQLSLEKAQRNLDKTYVYAPISGVIETRGAKLYETASTNAAAFTIANNDAVLVKFNASSDGAAALEVGDTVTVTRSAATYEATIVEIESKADSTTGLFPIKASLMNSDGTLLSGISVKVTAATAKAEDAMLVPVDTIYYDNGQAYVFTYEDGKAVRKDIETGMSDAETMVVTSGLTETSQIITTWHPDLKDGASVKLTEEAIASIKAAGGTVPDAAADPSGGLRPVDGDPLKAESEPAEEGDASGLEEAPLAPDGTTAPADGAAGTESAGVQPQAQEEPAESGSASPDAVQAAGIESGGAQEDGASPENEAGDAGEQSTPEPDA